MTHRILPGVYTCLEYIRECDSSEKTKRGNPEVEAIFMRLQC